MSNLARQIARQLINESKQLIRSAEAIINNPKGEFLTYGGKYGAAAKALRDEAEKLGEDHIDYHNLHDYADMLQSTRPENHNASAKLLNRYDTAFRDIVLEKIDKHSSKEDADAYHAAGGFRRLR